jgi:hypothetical protein
VLPVVRDGHGPPDPFPQRLPGLEEDAPEGRAASEYFIGERKQRHR